MGLSYQQVYLKPRYSKHNSRSEIDVSVKLGHQTFKVPAVPANMKCTIDTRLAKWMSENGYFYIMHRFGTKPTSLTDVTCWEDNYQFIKTANEENWKTISVSVGVQEGDVDLLLKTRSEGLRIDYLTIDIAHAHSIRMQKMIAAVNRIYSRVRQKPFVIAGNVATPEAVVDLENWGADCVKVGIAQGGACTTYGMTGFGVPMFSCMLECSEVAKNPLIADGGVKTNGDFAKAIRVGATMVMAGSVFAACKDAPGENIYAHGLSPDARYYQEDKNNITKKVYYGSASEYNKRSKRHVEGTRLELPCNGKTYEEKYQEIADSYSSSVSYAGGDLKFVEWGVHAN